MVKYDDASWHFGGEFPPDLNEDNARTHMGMFLAWVIDAGLEGEILREQFPTELEAVKQRRMTGAEFLRACCDDVLTNDDFNDEGNAFAMSYYKPGSYYEDYDEALGDDLPTLYHIEGSWENFALIKKRLDMRFAEWKGRQ